MTTMRSSTPDALDGGVEEGECQMTKSQICIPNFLTNSSGISATGRASLRVVHTSYIARFNSHHATSQSISFTIKDSAKRLTKHKFSAAANGGIHYCLQKAPTTLFFQESKRYNKQGKNCQISSHGRANINLEILCCKNISVVDGGYEN